METREKGINLPCFAAIVGLLFIMMMAQGCNLLFPASDYFELPSGYTRFKSSFPPDDSTDPIDSGYCEGLGAYLLYGEIKKDATISMRVASGPTDYITSVNPGTFTFTGSDGATSFEFKFSSSTKYVAFCYHDVGKNINSYAPTDCKAGVISVNSTASPAPYFEYAGSKVSASINLPQLGKVKVKATTSGATVYAIWKTNNFGEPSSTDWDNCIMFSVNELEIPIDFNGASQGVLYARERDVGKDRSIDNTSINVYRNDTVVTPTNYNLTVTYESKVLGTRNYFMYLASLASASYTATRTAVYSNQNVTVATIPNGFYVINVRSDPDGAWAFPQTGTPNFSVSIAGVKITVKGPSGDGFFTVKNGVVYDGFVN